MIVEQVDMTPAMAKSLLAGNDKNRTVSEQRVAMMATQMNAGQWKLNGETVILGDSGRLLDGQHRLAAVIVSGATVPMIIARGASDDTFETIDTGRTRKTADIIGISGQRHARESAATASNLYKMMTGTQASAALPPHYVIEMINRFPSLDGWVDRYKTSKGVRVLTGAGPFVPMLVYLSDIAMRPELAASLFDGIESGQRLSIPDPILAIRNRLIRLKGDKHTMSVLTAWTTFVRGVDAMEAGDPLERIMATKTTNELAPPKKLKVHMQKVDPSKWIDDLPVPMRTPKIRNQTDIMNRLVNK